MPSWVQFATKARRPTGEEAEYGAECGGVTGAEYCQINWYVMVFVSALCVPICPEGHPELSELHNYSVQRVAQMPGVIDYLHSPPDLHETSKLAHPVTADHQSMSEPPAHSKGTTMKNLVLTTITAGALASAALGLAGTANAAPTGPSPVDQTSKSSSRW